MRNAAESQPRGRDSTWAATPLALVQPEGKEGKVVGTATGPEPEAQTSRAPSDGGEFNGRAARSSQPFLLGQLPSSGPGPAQQGDVKNPNPDRKHTLARIPHRHTYSGPARHTQQRPSLPLARVLHPSPFPSHWSRLRVEERPPRVQVRPCTASAAGCGVRRSRPPGRRWAWS